MIGDLKAQFLDWPVDLLTRTTTHGLQGAIGFALVSHEDANVFGGCGVERVTRLG